LVNGNQSDFPHPYLKRRHFLLLLQHNSIIIDIQYITNISNTIKPLNTTLKNRNVPDMASPLYLCQVSSSN
jgi:hypothetical protein